MKAKATCGRQLIQVISVIPAPLNQVVPRPDKEPLEAKPEAAAGGETQTHMKQALLQENHSPSHWLPQGSFFHWS